MDKQRGGHSGQAHKNPSKLKTDLEGLYKRDDTARQSSVFLLGWLIPVLNKKEPMICERSHKIIGSASMRLAL